MNNKWGGIPVFKKISLFSPNIYITSKDKQLHKNLKVRNSMRGSLEIVPWVYVNLIM